MCINTIQKQVSMNINNQDTFLQLYYATNVILGKYFQLAGHPLRGWPARLRGHKGSGLWKVWTVPSPPHPTPPLPPSPPSPPLPCPAPPPLPCPALPCPALPPSLPRTLFRVRPRSNLAALWITAETAVSRYWWARESGAARRSLSENEAKSAMFVRVLRKMFFWKRRITRAVIGMGTNEWPSPLPEG